MNTKRLIILSALCLTMGAADVAQAQGFLNKLKNKGEQLLRNKTNKVIDKATPEPVKKVMRTTDEAEGKVRRAKNRATGNSRSSRNGIANFNPNKKTITVKFCEGVGRKLWHGRVGGITPVPPENGPKQVTWVDALPMVSDIDNARLVAETKMMDKWVADGKPYLEPTMMRREMGGAELTDRVNAVEKVVNCILSTYKDDELGLGAAMENDLFKRAVNSDLSPLYSYLPADVVKWLKSIDRTTKTLDVVVSEGNSSSAVRVQQGDMWFRVNTSTREAKLEYLDMDQSVGRDYTVPATINYAGYTFRVTEIGETAFGNLKVRSVTLPEGLKTIGAYAFTRTRISSFSIPSTVTEIGNYAFAQNPALKTIVVPAGVKKLGLGIFSLCTSLTSATLPDNVDKMGNTVFWGCSALTQVKLPQNLTEIPTGTFRDCKSLARVDIPASVTKIGQGAFQGCGLTSVTFPAGLTEIESEAFESCNRLTAVSIPGSAECKFMSFRNCKGLKKVTIGERYKSTPYELNSIFMGCSFVNPRMTTTPACVTYQP